jgi:hypothetical protein
LCIVIAESAATELKWQSGRARLTQKSPSAAPSKARFQRHRDAAVRTVAYEEEPTAGPRLTSGDAEPQLISEGEGRATLRSVVVNREAHDEPVRSAQLPPLNSTPPPAEPGADQNLKEELLTPFGESPPQEPTMDTPDPDLQLDEKRELQLEDTPPQPLDAEPRTFQPIPRTDPNALERDGRDPLAEEPGQTAESCEESLADLKAKTIYTVKLDIGVTGTAGTDFPFECSIDDGTWHAGRCWPQLTYLWKASALCHKPLYFEDEQLERYGHSWPPCFQPFVSGAHFFTRLPVLPYCMGVEPPNECIYALGHYRPGSCAPYMCNPVPISARGALLQAGAVVGTAAVLP